MTNTNTKRTEATYISFPADTSVDDIRAVLNEQPIGTTITYFDSTGYADYVFTKMNKATWDYHGELETTMAIARELAEQCMFRRLVKIWSFDW